MDNSSWIVILVLLCVVLWFPVSDYVLSRFHWYEGQENDFSLFDDDGYDWPTEGSLRVEGMDLSGCAYAIQEHRCEGGETRYVVLLFSPHDIDLVGEYDTREEAIQAARDDETHRKMPVIIHTSWLQPRASCRQKPN